MKPSDKKKLKKKTRVPEVDVKAIFALYSAEARKRRMRKLAIYALVGALSGCAIAYLLSCM